MILEYILCSEIPYGNMVEPCLYPGNSNVTPYRIACFDTIPIPVNVLPGSIVIDYCLGRCS